MHLNNYSVRVIGGTEKDSGYVYLSHGKVYKLQLRNDHGIRCDAEVHIDGKLINTFRIPQWGSITLERAPGDDRGRFTFYKEGTQEAERAQIHSGDSNNGLISVVFTPEKRRPVTVTVTDIQQPYYLEDIKVKRWPPQYSSNMANVRGSSASPGGTGLSGHSDQEFIDVGAIEHDYSGRTTITLRLVCDDDEDPRPLIGLSNPIPPYPR